MNIQVHVRTLYMCTAEQRIVVVTRQSRRQSKMHMITYLKTTVFVVACLSVCLTGTVLGTEFSVAMWWSSNQRVSILLKEKTSLNVQLMTFGWRQCKANAQTVNSFEFSKKDFPRKYLCYPQSYKGRCETSPLYRSSSFWCSTILRTFRPRPRRWICDCWQWLRHPPNKWLGSDRLSRLG